MTREKFLNRKFIAGCAVFIVLLFMFLMALFSSSGLGNDPGDSGIVDEIAHIPAGYSYDKYLDYRLNPEHPPLVKALAALPLIFNKTIKGPDSNWSWNGINQWEAGSNFIYEGKNDSKAILFWSRLPMMLLMICLGLFIYKWAAELFGHKVALFVLLLYAFYPDVIANGRLVTTDVAAAFGFVIATYYFDKAIRKKTWLCIVYAAVALAVAQLLKFSAVLLFLVFLILALFRAILDRKEYKNFSSALWANFKAYFWVCTISLAVVWIVYIFFCWNTPASIEHQVINSNLPKEGYGYALFRSLLHRLENNVVTRSIGHYLLGIVLVVAQVNRGATTYIMGEVSGKGISWYFPVAWFLKTAIPLIIFFTASLFLLPFKWFKQSKSSWLAPTMYGLGALSIVAVFIALRFNNHLIPTVVFYLLFILLPIYILFFWWPKQQNAKWLTSLLLVPFIVYWGFTLKGSLNIGVRHLLPTVPFVLLMIGYAFYPFINNIKKYSLQVMAVLGLTVYLIISTLSNYPNFIPYFNELTPKDQRYTKLVDSSLDWGQDLLRLRDYVVKNNIKNLKINYFGGPKSKYYFPDSEEWYSRYEPQPGWFAISATPYQYSKYFGALTGKWSYHWLDEYKPSAIIGGSILVFHVTDEDFKKHPPQSPYPIIKIKQKQ